MIPLAQAYSFGPVRLLDPIWMNSEPHSYWTADSNLCWSVCGYLRTDIQYYRYQFTKSLCAAAKRGDLNLIRWILEHSVNCTAGVEVVEEAARWGRLEILRFLLDFSTQDTQTKERNRILWGRYNMEAATQAGHDEIARWLHVNTPNAGRDLNRVMKFAVRRGDMALIQWLLDEIYSLETHLPPPSTNDAAVGEHMEILQWILWPRLP